MQYDPVDEKWRQTASSEPTPPIANAWILLRQIEDRVKGIDATLNGMDKPLDDEGSEKEQAMTLEATTSTVVSRLAEIEEHLTHIHKRIGAVREMLK